MNDKQLQRLFEGKIFNIGNIKRECYYCTFEDDGAWFWLRITKDDDCRKINFIVYNKDAIHNLYNQIENNEKINFIDYGYLSFQK